MVIHLAFNLKKIIVYLHKCLNLGTETVAGLCQGVLVEVAR